MNESQFAQFMGLVTDILEAVANIKTGPSSVHGDVHVHYHFVQDEKHEGSGNITQEILFK